jgi:acyl dehydratase
MSPSELSSRKFTVADQEWFALNSGDRNPMHMDALAARRTMAGFPVVHGIHTLLWALDSLFRSEPGLPQPSSIKAAFEKMIYVDDDVYSVVTRVC